MSQIIGVYGAAGCGRGVMPMLRTAASGGSRLVFVDDQAGATEINGHPAMTFEQFASSDAKSKSIIIAIASPAVRGALAGRCAEHDIGFASVVAENHVRMDDCHVGEGAIFSPFTTLTSNIRIGSHFHCNIGSYVEHDCVIGDFVTFAPGVKCNGNIHIGDRAYIGAGAIIRQGTPDQPMRIGAGAVVGMGAVVTRDVAAGETVIGNPARPMIR
jgi:sugar O-acyltransferase (sialic acid O-acetyltransferase NeuD family)